MKINWSKGVILKSLFKGTNNQFHRFIVVQEHLLAKYSYYMTTCNHFGLQVVIITVL